MLAYAASRPTPVERRPYPNAMLAIIAVHVGVAALVMSAKMEFPPIAGNTPIDIFTVKEPTDPPPPNPSHKTSRPQTVNSDPVTRVDPIQPVGLSQDPPIATGGSVGPGTGDQVALNFPLIRPPIHEIVKLGPTLLTSGEDLKPPYPSSKLLTEEEAVLTLRLAIDERGRVVGVEPVGRTDPVFLAAARRHLIAHWRYKPASEDGRAMPSSAVITLRFQLDG